MKVLNEIGKLNLRCTLINEKEMQLKTNGKNSIESTKPVQQVQNELKTHKYGI